MDGLRDYAGGDEAFLSWLRKVDAVITRLSGVGLLDLPDYLYRDAYDAGVNVRSVAREALTEAGL